MILVMPVACQRCGRVIPGSLASTPQPPEYGFNIPRHRRLDHFELVCSGHLLLNHQPSPPA